MDPYALRAWLKRALAGFRAGPPPASTQGAALPANPDSAFCARSEIPVERAQIEAELRIAAAAFEAQEAMLIMDAQRNVLRVNRAFTEVSGFTASEAVGRPVSWLRTEQHGSPFYAAMWTQVEQKGYWRGEMYARRRDGSIYPTWSTLTAVSCAKGNITHYVATLTDISRAKAAEKEIRDLAYYDPLTRLANRRLLVDHLQQALAQAARSGIRSALLFIDLDNFKNLNDTAGHEIGDQLLQQVAKRLALCVREGDTVARLGGDEFVVLLDGVAADPQQAAWLTEQVGTRVLAALNQPYHLGGQQHFSSPSIGAAVFGGQQETVADLLRRADLAMYQAKAGGRNGLRFFDPAMQAAISERTALEAGIRAGLERGEFLLHYQKQISSDGRLLGAEALVRWQHPQRGLLAPGEFIPLAEESGLIIPLGLHVLELACHQLAAWQRGRSRNKDCGFSLSVNVSARQFRQPDFVEQVLRVLDRTGADASMLKLELTESMLVDDVEETIARMNRLKARGVGFSLDDFGVGFSSLSYLKRLPLDQLKIDQSFVRDVLVDPNDAAIAQMIVALGKSLGLQVIAEGVETDAQRLALEEAGCHAYQGYLYGRPMPAAQFETLLHSLPCVELRRCA